MLIQIFFIIFSCIDIAHFQREDKQFICKNSTEIDIELICDGKNDCVDNSDETVDLCFHIICPVNMYRCLYGACIPESKRCDGKIDCADSSDEFQCNNEKRSCSKTQYQCTSGECIQIEKLCDNNFDCVDKSDEIRNICEEIICPENTFHCKIGGCVRMEALCNNFEDCVDGSDEADLLCQHKNCNTSLCKEPVVCPPILSTRLSIKCKEDSGVNKGIIPCNEPVPVGTIANYECKEYYKPSSEQDVVNTKALCQVDGSWSRNILKCEPECGKMEAEATALVVHGWASKPGQWPWHAVLYTLEDGKWTYWCGGSLIAEKVVLTAAHCVWKMNADDFQIGLGKFYSDINTVDDYTQMINVSKIIIQPLYQDVSGNYGSDIAVMILSIPAQLSEFIRPVCIDWQTKYVMDQLKENNHGTVVGLGMMENETFPEYLKVTTLPVVSDEQCLKHQKHDFKKYVTYTSFCAGYQNGTGVCNGDSGGGLVFPNENTWYLQGIVSISPRKHGTSFCDPNYFTVFTKIGKYVDWLKDILMGFHVFLNDEVEVESNVVY